MVSLEGVFHLSYFCLNCSSELFVCFFSPSSDIRNVGKSQEGQNKRGFNSMDNLGDSSIIATYFFTQGM